MVRPAPGPSHPPVGLPLTDREREVLDLVTRTGGSRKAAAAALGLGGTQVDRHLASAFAKLGVDSIGAARGASSGGPNGREAMRRPTFTD